MNNLKVKNSGFVLVPVIMLMLVSLLMILTASKELRQAVLMHQLKLQQDCLYLESQLKIEYPNPSFCPPCSKAVGC